MAKDTEFPLKAAQRQEEKQAAAACGSRACFAAL
jgi:hypothetical protein